MSRKKPSVSAEGLDKFLSYILIILLVVMTTSIVARTVDNSITNKKIRETYEQLEKVSQEQENLLLDQHEINNHLKELLHLEGDD